MEWQRRDVGDDTYLYLPIMERVKSLYVVNKPLYHYVKHPNSIVALHYKSFSKKSMRHINATETSWFKIAEKYNNELQCLVKESYIFVVWETLLTARWQDDSPDIEKMVNTIRDSRKYFAWLGKLRKAFAYLLVWGVPRKLVVTLCNFCIKLRNFLPYK